MLVLYIFILVAFIGLGVGTLFIYQQIESRKNTTGVTSTSNATLVPITSTPVTTTTSVPITTSAPTTSMPVTTTTSATSMPITTTTSMPITTTSAPITSRPVTTTSMPITTISGPITSRPVTTTSAPITSRPVTTTFIPNTTTLAPTKTPVITLTTVTTPATTIVTPSYDLAGLWAGGTVSLVKIGSFVYTGNFIGTNRPAFTMTLSSANVFIANFTDDPISKIMTVTASSTNNNNMADTLTFKENGNVWSRVPTYDLAGVWAKGSVSIVKTNPSMYTGTFVGTSRPKFTMTLGSTANTYIANFSDDPLYKSMTATASSVDNNNMANTLTFKENGGIWVR